MKYILYFYCFLWVLFPSSPWAAEDVDVSGLMVLQVPQDIPPYALPTGGGTISPNMDYSDTSSPYADWYSLGREPTHKGDLWEKGLSVQDLANVRRHISPESTLSTMPHVITESGVDTSPAIDARPKYLPDYKYEATQGNAVTGKDRAIRGEFFSDERAWRNPVTEPFKIDEETFVNKRDVVGAYADMINTEDLQISVGPELYLPFEEVLVPLTSQKNMQQSEVGFGMQFQWGF